MKLNFSLFAMFLSLALLFTSCASSATNTEETNPTDETGSVTVVETGAKTTEPQGPDPKKDNQLNILLIGNSYSYYWTEELWGLLNAAGYKNVSVCNVYYSGCTFEMHWDWHQKNEKNYDFYTVDHTGRHKKSGVSLSECVGDKIWDIVSFQQSGKYVYGSSGGIAKLYESVMADLPLLYKYLQENHPLADYYYQQSWSHEIGNGVADLEEQKEKTNVHRVVARQVCQKYNMCHVPCGDAWEAVRHDPLITEGGKTLTTRIYKGQSDYDDLTHDGDVGGGQYLNACVWFEAITKTSCVGNSYRPQYVFENRDMSLSEEKIALLQNAAHRAVAAVLGEMPASKA